MSTYQRGLRATILRSTYTPRSATISAKYDEVVIVGPGIPEMHPVRDDAPAVTVYAIGDYVALRPVAKPPQGRTSYMASGAYVCQAGFSKEWRGIFGHNCAIPLHDYTHTWDAYNQHD